MPDPSESKPSNSVAPLSATEPVAEVKLSSETDARTFVEKTLSESGNESAQLSASQKLPEHIGEGSMLGLYQIVRKLGQGGMGAVYEARHTKLKKTVAVKVLPQEMLKTPALITRFEREMEAVGALDHPHIVRAMDANEHNGTHYLVMEFVAGSDLSQWVKEHGPLSVHEACDAIRQTALGLQHAHEHGLVHRDIKPSNLLASILPARRASEWLPSTDKGDHSLARRADLETFTIKILDLGLARLGEADESRAGLTSSGQVLGTPDYMAPEQWDDTHSVDGRADLYSLGCTLFYLLTGKAPFSADKPRSILHLMKAHVENEIPDLTERCPQVPAEVNAVYRRLLAKKPEDRFATAAEVAAALEPFTHRDERSRHAPRDEPNASSTPNSNPTLPQTQSITPSTPDEPSTSIPRSAHHAERDGYVDAPNTDTTTIIDSASGAASAPRSVTEPMHRVANATPLAKDAAAESVSRRGTSRRRWLIAVGFFAFAVLAGFIIKHKNGDDARRMAAPGRPSDTLSNTKTAEGGHPTNTIGWHGWPAEAPPPAIAPFNAEQAQQHQEAWAKYLGVPVEYTNSLGMKFRLIPPGEFSMGSTKEEIEITLEEVLKIAGENKQWQECFKSEDPQHKVILTQPIYIGIHEVTQGRYEQLMGKNPSGFSPTGVFKDKVADLDWTSLPVESVSWSDAAEFCAKLSEHEKYKPFYFRTGESVTPLVGTGYRLATEAEWEFACRAGTTTRFWSGDKYEDLVPVGWDGNNSGGRTHAVGELKGNPFGLFDVHGNVFEWVQDRWEATYYGQFAKTPAVDPIGSTSTGSERIYRSGRWCYFAGQCRSAARNHMPGDYSIGLRVSLVVDAVRQSLKLTGPARPNRPKASVTDGSTSSTAKPLTPLPPLDLDETDPLPGWELPAGAPPPVVAPCEPTLATERQQQWAEFLKRPVIEELDVAALAVAAFAKTFDGKNDPEKAELLGK